MLVEDSSSLSVNRLVIRGIQQTLPGVYKITPDAGSAFFLRIEYLSHLTEENLMDLLEKELNVEQQEDILESALCYSCEVCAMNYLSRSEHSRFGLEQKLIKKGISKQVISKVLDFLEDIHYLDDLRFSGAWLRSRSIDHAEGRSRLLSELMARGVSKRVCDAALDEFFESHDELELCRKSYLKIKRFKSDEEKIIASLQRNGFSYKIIKIVLEENEQ